MWILFIAQVPLLWLMAPTSRRFFHFYERINNFKNYCAQTLSCYIDLSFLCVLILESEVLYYHYLSAVVKVTTETHFIWKQTSHDQVGTTTSQPHTLVQLLWLMFLPRRAIFSRFTRPVSGPSRFPPRNHSGWSRPVIKCWLRIFIRVLSREMPEVWCHPTGLFIESRDDESGRFCGQATVLRIQLLEKGVCLQKEKCATI